ncbi:TPA: hypothetical protein ACN37W_004529 [Vibrio parahaemolyticus]
MKYVLVKYKKLKLLINEGCHSESLIENLTEIEQLNDEFESFCQNLLTASDDYAKALEQKKQQLISKIGYRIIGTPFTNHDAELYVLDKHIPYDVLKLHGNVGNENAVKDNKEFEQINIRVEKPLKTLAVKHVNSSEHKSLTQYIEYLIKKDLNLE